MSYEWIDEYCLSKKGVEKDYKLEWGAIRYMIRGKMFAMQGSDKMGEPIITTKLEPSQGEFLRNKYKDIIPGYYMNKVHWNSLYLEGNVPDDIVKDMLDNAYALIFLSLSKKTQKEILEGVSLVQPERGIKFED
ncbi:MmcQ/YjbR family DNA-binding protein [Acetobacterium bakii]|uniref:MmcQ n=1 Tax=Acetobacterium bakii TaxID=52689 RepID=A0A0L6U4H2_9FIRM|nr:MmcQ/YjbR family DNA-binding protein [Acetobacterium bakii]KNZ43409.1 MmcQ [Acetobacterium bakii]